MIHVLSVPSLVMASIVFYAGFYHLLLYIKRPQIREHLPFAFLCFSVGLYNIFCFGLYNSDSVESGIVWQRLQLYSVSTISIFLSWFTGIFTEQKNNKIIRFFISSYILLFLCMLISGPDLTLSVNSPAVKDIHIGRLINITYYEGKTGPVFLISIVFSITGYIYLFYLYYLYSIKTKSKALRFFIAGLVIYFFGVINDTLVSARAYSFIYLSEYCFFIIVITMIYILFDQYASLHKSYEELNKNLELKVSERTEEITKLNRALMLSNIELEHFASVASHDLQEPLRKIKSYLELLIKKYQPELDNHGVEYINRINNSAARMQALIDDLLTYSRITAKAEPFILVDLSMILKDVLSDLELYIEKTAGKVFVESLPVIRADPVQIRRLFQNLISNALKFHKPGESPVVKIYEIKDESGKYAGIAVEDNGIGINEDDINKIFHLFQRLHGKNEYEGSGIGLAVCKKIAERHGGEIIVESKAGEGSRFILRLPAA